LAVGGWRRGEGKTVMRAALSLTAGILVVACSACSPSQKISAADRIFAADVFKKSRDAYASLSSYCDEGTYFHEGIVTIDQASSQAVTFRTKMSRPDSYRISWTYLGENVLWCAGEDDFRFEESVGPRALDWEKRNADPHVQFITNNLKLKNKSPDQIKIFSKTDNLAKSPVVVPEIFFGIPLRDQHRMFSNPLDVFPDDEHRLPDGKISGVDCYVFISAWYPKSSLTIWIGKSDFLIRQIKILKPGEAGPVSALALKKVDDEFLKELLESPMGSEVYPDNGVTVETHSNITVNQKFSPADFLQ
jgi:hypothetical protein